MTTVVLLPGNMCDARLWRGGDGAIPTALADAGLAVADADLTRDATIAAMAAYTLATTEGRLLPFGFSMGAIVAVEIAVQAPDRVVGMVLAGYNATADLPERAAVRPRQQADVRAGLLERVLVDELKPNYLAAGRRDDLMLLALLRDMGMELGPAVFVGQSEALRLRSDRVEALAALRVPVLYLCGGDDALCPPDWHRRWATITPDATVDVIEGAGHMLPLEAPAAFASACADWINAKDIA